jgi:hypothetical protein
MSGFELKRIGQIMEPEPGNPLEVQGILNPAAIRGPDGQLYLFLRLVSRGNYSSIDIGRHNDLGLLDRIDVLYGMADNRNGEARLDAPECLSPGALTDGDGPKTEGQE